MIQPTIKFIKLLHKKSLQIESFILVSMFLIILSIAVLQILLRNFFDSGILWADTFLRITVLWLGMMGALFASRDNHHINMNLGLKYLSGKTLRYVQAIIHLFTTTICIIVSWFGVNLVLMEYEEAGIAFASIPIWVTVSIIPIGFAIMGLRYLSLFILVIIDQKQFKN
ncbi:MAG: TRAP transporter small permease [Gammaproteobacteria bacterium]|nr:TRAP transporter small permease [Gammaproteobacteria bacterium]